MDVTIDEDGTSQYAIVDGQQRIRAILQFMGADRDEAEREYDCFSLQYLDPIADFYNRTFEDLSAERKRDFFAYPLAVQEINDADDDDVRKIFARLNKYLTKLSPQELRNAIYSGPFVKLANELTDDEYWAENRIVSAAIIRRMGDIEFVSELLIGVLDGPQSGKSEVIDEYYQRFEEYDDEFPGQGEAKRRFARTLGLIQGLIPDIKESRWRNRTDFYSLFVAISHKLRTHVVRETEFEVLGNKLEGFADQVDSSIQSPQVKAPQYVSDYAQAHVKGTTDKSRRAARHQSLLRVIDSFFEEKKPARTSRKAV